MTNQISKDPLKELQDILNQSNSFVRQLLQTPSEDVTMVMGMTRSGKSTLVNYLIGNTLQAEYDEIEYNRYLKIQETSTNKKGPAIGHGALSETTIPTRYESPYNGIIWDLPGFGDNKGAAQDITNAYFIRSLINRTESCKLLLVADYDTLNTGNVKLFTDLLAQVHSLFPTIIENTSGISIVFTKYEMNFRGRLKKDPKDVITSKLKTKIIDNKNLVITNHDSEANDKLKTLVKYFVDHPDLICVLNRPANDDEIWKINTDTPLVNTLQAINFIPTTELMGGFSLSPESSIFLLEHCATLSEMKGIKKLVQKIKAEYRSYFNKLQEDINSKNFDIVENEISRLEQNFEQKLKPIQEINQISITGTLLELSAFSPECYNEVVRSIISTQEEFIVFAQGILETNNRCAPIIPTIYVKIIQSFETVKKELLMLDADLKVAKGDYALSEAKELKEKLEQEAETKYYEQKELIAVLEDVTAETVTYWQTCKQSMGEAIKGAVVSSAFGTAAGATAGAVSGGAIILAGAGVVVLSPVGVAVAVGVVASSIGSVYGMAKGLSESRKKHQEVESKKQTIGQELEIKTQEKNELEAKLSQAQAEEEKRTQDLKNKQSYAEISKELAKSQSIDLDDHIWGSDNTDYINPYYSSAQSDQRHNNPEGRGLSMYEQNGLQHVYWSIYSKEAMQQLLELRLEEANIPRENKIKIVSPNKSWDNSTELLKQIVLEISSLIENTVFIPLNIYNKHWVGIAIEKTPGIIKISYMDPEQQASPIMLQDKLTEFIAKEYSGYQVKFKEIQLEKQKYDNCGPEVIENFMLYLSGERFDQDTAVLNHSRILEETLAFEDKNEGQFVNLDYNQEIQISELPIDLLGNDFVSMHHSTNFSI